MKKQPWIGKPLIDVLFILLPPFLCLGIIAIFPEWFQNSAEMPDAGWVMLILLIDVAHVYSTLYRTYFDPVAFAQQRSLLIGIPVVSFIGGVVLYSLSSIWFWRILAYVAVFHFVRQQYGFMRVYSRQEIRTPWKMAIDKFIIYYATLYPLLYWHLTGPKNFNWFMDGDFVYASGEKIVPVLTVIYFLSVFIYLLKEIISTVRDRFFNIPKFSIIAGTLCSWYFGIIYYNGDMAFTLLNVVSHGIPYMALIWIYGRKNYLEKRRGSAFLRLLFSSYGLVVFLGLLFLLAFVEEGLWDLGVWQEHGQVFGFSGAFKLNLSDRILAFLVPFLALPQITHYILDGFIWRIRKDNFKWNSEVRTE